MRIEDNRRVEPEGYVAGDIIEITFKQVEPSYFLITMDTEEKEIRLVNICNGELYYRKFTHTKHMVNHLNKHVEKWEHISQNKVKMVIE